jgi:predicted XRE-type DNA-binding protein
MWGVNNEEALRARVVDEITVAIRSLGLPHMRADERFGYPKGTIARIVNGNTQKFSLAKLLSICDDLGINLHLRDSPIHDGLRDPWWDSEPPDPPM